MSRAWVMWVVRRLVGVRRLLPVIMLVALAGCSVDAGVDPAAPTFDADGFPSDVPVELKVRHPKDARGFGPCELLTVAQQRAMGFDPATAKAAVDGLAETCFWYYPGKRDYAGLGLSTDPTGGKLPDIWRGHHGDANYEQFEVAGHPAIRTDLTPDRFCTFTVAIADLQTIVVTATADLTPRPDPCAPSRRMAELILSNLPPLVPEPR